MRILVLLIFLISCTPSKPVDSQYYRHCRRTCIGAGLSRVRVVEDERGYHCQCAPDEDQNKSLEKT